MLICEICVGTHGLSVLIFPEVISKSMMTASPSISTEGKKKTLFEYTNKDILVFASFYKKSGASLIAQLGKNLPAVQETQVQFLGWEDPLEKEMATNACILAWKIP